MSNLRQRMIQDMKIRNYSPRTIQVYIDRVAKFAHYFGTSPDRLTREHIRKFQRYLVEDKKCSWSQLNQTVCALRFLYRVCLGKAAIVEYIPYAKQPKSLPVVCSRGEVRRMLEAARYLKHPTGAGEGKADWPCPACKQGERRFVELLSPPRAGPMMNGK